MANQRFFSSLLNVTTALLALGLPFAVSSSFAQEEGATPSASQLLDTPVTNLRIGDTSNDERPPIPDLRNAEAIQRGMDLYNQMNCVGCHAPNGGGGMGPALSNSEFIYGSDPINIFLSIAQGRPRGMPAWNQMLAEESIWDMVAYILSISNEERQAWGNTVSRDTFKIEQVPAQMISTPEPWAHTRPFSFGKPTPENKGDK